MLTWFRQIDDASNIDAVIAVAREYFATLTPQELALLPPRCRPRTLRGERDLEEMHVTLVDEYRRTNAEGDALSTLQRMTSFLVRASVRAAQLAEDRGDQRDEPPGVDPERSAAPRGRE